MKTPEVLYDCPVCLGVKLKKIQLTAHTSLLLDYCPRCGGMWFDKGEVERLQQFQPASLNKKIVLNQSAFSMQCHYCFSFFDRNAALCPNCHWKNVLLCPVCQKNMTRHLVHDMWLDACKNCKGVWFDQIELAQLWNLNLTQPAVQRARSDSSTRDIAEFFLDVFLVAPDLTVYGAAALARTGVTVLKNSGELLAQSPEITGALIEGAGSAATKIFEAIIDILSELFQ